MTEAEKFQLVDDIMEFRHDPLGYVLYAFTWGKGELSDESGPEDWQIESLTAIGDALKKGEITVHEAIQIAVASGHGIGKALDADTPIPTPTGFKRIADLRPGSVVYGANGQPTLVVATKNQGVRPSYRVTFDDGSSVVADENHLWAVRGRNQRRLKQVGWKTLTTKEILDAGVLRSNGSAKAKQWEIPIQGAVCGGKSFEHPYAVGVWLGDGSRNRSGYSKPDMEVVEQIKMSGLSVRAGANNAKYIHGFRPTLERLGVFSTHSYDRFIANECFEWDAESRAELLRGLLDTDGECGSHGTIVFNSTSKNLAVGVMALARSLGGKASLQPTVKQGWFKGVRHRDCYRVTIQMPTGFRCFYIERKQSRVHQTVQRRYLSRWIESIERVEDRETVCIEVAAQDSLFLAGQDYIVTHNSAMVAWLILWGLSTFEDTRIVITANTDGQLSTKTWPELAVWHRRAINKDWFIYTATSLYSGQKKHEKTWRADAIPWSVHNTEAFAGLHNAKGRIILIFDEASAIDDKIWEVSEGALTDKDTEILWLAFGNPTRNTGRFRQCFGKFKHRWITKQIDSRTVRRTNKTQLQKWVDDYGEDSDFVRIRVTGKFPRASSLQLFSTDLVAEAMRREARSTLMDPLIMALDVARGGDDNCVIRFRRGLDARSIPPITIPGSEVKDSMRLVSKVVQVLEEKKPDAFFYDGTGVGGPVGDRVRQLGYPVMEVQFGSGSPDPRQGNFRAYMYQKALDWLNAGGALDSNNELETDLTSITYFHNKKDQLMLESKEDMKKRGLASPDHGDSFVMTFAYPVAPKMLGQSSQRSNADFDPYDESRRNH